MKNCEFGKEKPLPQQGNGDDCGVFICMYMHELILSKSVRLQQNDAFFFRQYMCSSIFLGE